MGDKSKIEWTEATWNPFAGCSKVSPGCKNCYAIRDAHRLSNNTNEKIRKKYEGTVTPDGKNWTGKMNLDEEALLLPLRWTKPRKIFVNSMSDLFHENVPDEWIKKVFTVMALCPQHIFQVLTKRPERMKAYFEKQKDEWSDLGVSEYAEDIECAAFEFIYKEGKLKKELEEAGWWRDYHYTEEGKKDGARLYYSEIEYLQNVWLGVSVEDQKTANERIPLLLKTPAAIRWLSVEPLLDFVNLTRLQETRFSAGTNALNGTRHNLFSTDTQYSKIDWVVIGGESGHNARSMHPDWVRSIRDQCQAASVPFFFKQWGEWTPRKAICELHGENGQEQTEELLISGRWAHWRNGQWMCGVGKKKAGRILDGRTWDEMPIVKP